MAEDKVIATYDKGTSALCIYKIDYKAGRVIVRWSNSTCVHSIRLYVSKGNDYYFKLNQVAYYIKDFQFEDGE